MGRNPHRGEDPVRADDGDADEPESRRQVARRERRTSGERSGAAAHTLMEMPEPQLASLGLDDELRESVAEARAVTAHGARRRAERHLAGLLRQADLEALEVSLAKLEDSGRSEARQFQLAESWRSRLIDGSASAVDLGASCPGIDGAALAKAVDEAQREHTTGRPRGAARALFRLVMAGLQQAAKGR